MQHSQILKQSWQILWRYRLLWVFGFLVALTTAPALQIADWDDSWKQSQGTIIETGDHTISFPGFDATFDISQADGSIIITPLRGGEPSVIHLKDGLSIDLSGGAEQDLAEALELIGRSIPPDVTEIVVGSLLIIGLVILGAIIVAAFIRYPAEVALIKGVNQEAQTKKKASFRELLRMGWSRTAWRFFLIDLVVKLPLFVFFALLFIVALMPLLLLISGDPAGWIFGLVTSAALLFLATILAIVTSLLLSLFMQFFRRACALEDLGVTAAIVRGWRVIFHNLKDVFLMAILMVASTIGWTLAMVPLLIVLIPAFLVFIVLGGLVAVVVLFPVAGLAHLFLNDVLAWVLAGTLALVVFLPFIVAPYTFLRGLLEVFRSSNWTLTYRALQAMEKEAPELSKAEALLAKA